MKPRRSSSPSAPTGRYSTAPHTQGPGSNQTRAYLADVVATRGNEQLLWDNALNDLPGNRTYAQFKQALASPEGPKLLDAYARENRLNTPPTREQYAQAQFQAAQQRFLQRADQNPGQNLFAGAPHDAYSAQARAAFINNTLDGAASTGMAPSAAEQRRTYNQQADPGAQYIAPGMAVRRVVPAAPVVVPRRNTVATR
jgi:hypothetical protein